MQLNGVVAQVCDLAAEHVAVKAILVGRVLVGVKCDGSMNLAVVEISYVAFLVRFIILIEELLHLWRQDIIALKPVD